MNRTLLLKVLYLAAVLVLSGLALLLTVTVFRGRESFGAVLVVLVLLVPGRLVGFVFRDLFRGRRLLESGQPKEALNHLRAFLDQLRESPWKKRLLWLTWAIYTTDVEAIVWNNIGAAHTNLGNWNDAQEAYSKALAVDSKYPLPHFKLARLALLEGDQAEAERRFEAARTLGYRATSIDRLLQQAQAVLARVEGRGDTAINRRP